MCIYVPESAPVYVLLYCPFTSTTPHNMVCYPSLPPSPTGKKFRSKPQLARYLGNSMDLSSFDFRTGKMLMSKLNKNRQRLRYDNNTQTKVCVQVQTKDLSGLNITRLFFSISNSTSKL